ncbi:hypothetical protein GGR57DRAFT_516042 [Xylariaceae sp. FL1272]|nr:hypothetical protein GGR57DRAFT_516042 [Xylariaceae sp. FL1272]
MPLSELCGPQAEDEVPPANEAVERNTNRQLGPLERLPVEMRLEVAANLPDVESAMSLALSGPAFYELITKHEAEISARIVMNRIPRNLLPLAALSRQLQDLVRNPLADPTRSDSNLPATILSLIQKWLKDPKYHWKTYSHIRTLEDANKHLHLHRTVECFARMFRPEILRHAPQAVARWPGEAASRTLSTDEMKSLQRAFYIVEIVSSGFPLRHLPPRFQDRNDEYALAWTKLWSSFAPWHMQQVRFLQDRMGPFIRRVVEATRGVTPQFYYTDLEMRLFVVQEGLECLLSYDALTASWPEVESRLVLARAIWGSARSDLLHELGDELWLKEVDSTKEFSTFSLDASHIFPRFLSNEDDDGPATSWHYTLLYHPEIAERFDNVPDAELFGNACDSCISRFGWMFFDLWRLDQGCLQQLARIDELTRRGAHLTRNAGDDIPNWNFLRGEGPAQCRCSMIGITEE